MSWLPGVGPVKDISAVGITRGLSEDWYSSGSIHKSNRDEILKGNFWDIIDNPLYEAAAAGLDIDWDTWVEEAKGVVGTSPEDGSARVRAEVVAPVAGYYTTRGSGGPNSQRPSRTYHEPVAGEYEWMTKDEADAQGYSYGERQTNRWRNKETDEIIFGELTPPWERDPTFFQNEGRGYSYANPLYLAHKFEGWEDDWEELRDWGVYDKDVSEQLENMSDWLSDIVNINDNLHPIIVEGPKGEHYGIEGDIWEHYGLDQEPEPPKELDWDSYDKTMQLSTAVTSDVGYSTPEGITPVDLHGD